MQGTAAPNQALILIISCMAATGQSIRARIREQRGAQAGCQVINQSIKTKLTLCQ